MLLATAAAVGAALLAYTANALDPYGPRHQSRTCSFQFSVASKLKS
eukprot:SAG31_NODE_40830_length_279_cov_0.566667_1_plen_45_part_10